MSAPEMPAPPPEVLAAVETIAAWSRVAAHAMRLTAQGVARGVVADAVDQLAGAGLATPAPDGEERLPPEVQATLTALVATVRCEEGQENTVDIAAVEAHERAILSALTSSAAPSPAPGRPPEPGLATLRAKLLEEAASLEQLERTDEDPDAWDEGYDAAAGVIAGNIRGLVAGAGTDLPLSTPLEVRVFEIGSFDGHPTPLAVLELGDHKILLPVTPEEARALGARLHQAIRLRLAVEG